MSSEMVHHNPVVLSARCLRIRSEGMVSPAHLALAFCGTSTAVAPAVLRALEIPASVNEEACFCCLFFLAVRSTTVQD